MQVAAGCFWLRKAGLCTRFYIMQVMFSMLILGNSPAFKVLGFACAAVCTLERVWQTHERFLCRLGFLIVQCVTWL